MKKLGKASAESNQEETQIDFVTELETIYRAEQDGTAGWVSPLYSESSHVELNEETIAGNRCVGAISGVIETEFYKVLRAQVLRRTRGRNLNTLMVTSAQPGEGKTLTAINLAFTFAMEFNQTVLLVDCDLRQQKICQYLGYSSDRGLVDYLANSRPLKNLIVWPGIEKLCLISGGRTVDNAAEFLGSPKMKELVVEMKTRYSDRYVVFDVPPLLIGADALTFASLVDSIIMVVQADQTPFQDVERALELIPKEKFLGFVLNRKKGYMENYASYYSHSRPH